MLATCFPVLISLALAAPGVSRTCYIYCKSQKSELMKGDTPLECNCADFVDTDIKVKELSITTLDDTGVYFVPAELQVFQEQFASQPFFISNPAKLVPKSGVTRINGAFDATKDPLDDPMPSQSAHVEIHERTETISHTSINQKWGRSPLYLDIELEDLIDNERSADQKSTFIDDFELTEQALVECLDYQVIHYTRKYGFIKEFKEFWEARNLNKYEHLLDTEIEEKIQEFCSEPEAIVQQSLHEIKQGLPKKVPDSEVPKSGPEIVKKDRDVNSATKIKANLLENVSGAGNSTSPVTSTRLFDNNATEISETLNTENYTLSGNVTEQYDTTYDPTENWPFINLTTSSLLNKGNNYEIYQKTSPAAVTDSDILEITTEIPSIVDNHEKHIIPVNQAKRANERDAELDLDTMTSDTVYRTYIPTRQTDVKTTDNAQIFDKITSFLPTLTTASSKEESLGKETTTTEENISDVQLLNNNDTTQIVVTRAYSQVRNTFPEKEIKIPKITTKECENNTVQSIIDGTEELPNHDFIDSTAAESGRLETRKRNSDNENDITGKLYFVSKTELVPIRFVQKDTGTISLGIDGVALCDKLVRKTIKTSRLLTKLCDYVENV